ncbi:MAG: hypothetical protein FD146_655 [Anaerolineaceae bacterium]|nr:MAG: hypothetical protein FD146_655 [Anaerolineaceae bacterium]
MMDNPAPESNTETPPLSPFSYEQWRETLIRALLRGTLVFALPILIPEIIDATPVIASIYIAAYLIIAAVAFAPLPYWLRAGTFLAIAYGLGLSNLLEEGLYGGSRLFFLEFAVIAAILFTQRAARNAIIASVLTIALVGGLVLTGRLALVNEQIPPGSLAIWVSFTLTFILLTAVIVIGLGMFRREFDLSRQRTQESIELLRLERSRLEERVSDRTRALERRNVNLQATTRLSQLISQTRDENVILDQVVQLITEQLGHEHAGIFLLDEMGEYAILRVTNTEAGKALAKERYQLRAIRGEFTFELSEEEPLKYRAGNETYQFSPPTLLESMHINITLPIMAGNQLLGLLNTQSAALAIETEEQSVLQTIADQLAISLENARLFSQLQTQLREIEQLAGQSVQEAWKKVGTGTPIGYQYDRIQVMPSGEKFPAEITNELLEGKPVTYVTSDETRVSRLVAPIMLRGHVLGIIGYEENDPGHVWESDSIALLETIASQVGLTLENTRLIAEAQQRAQQEQLIGEVTSSMRETLDMDTVLQTAIREMRRSFGLKEAEIRLHTNKPASEIVQE